MEYTWCTTALDEIPISSMVCSVICASIMSLADVKAGLSSMTDVHERCVGAVMYWDRKPWTAEGSASATSLACDPTMRSNPALSTARRAITVLARLQQYKMHKSDELGPAS